MDVPFRKLRPDEAAIANAAFEEWRQRHGADMVSLQGHWNLAVRAALAVAEIMEARRGRTTRS